MVSSSYDKHRALPTRWQLCRHEQASFRCVLAALLGRPNESDRQAHAGRAMLRREYKQSQPSCRPSRHKLPLPDLACCIVRRRPDSARGRSLCRRDVWRLAHNVFLLSRIAWSEILYVSSNEHVVQDMYLVSLPAGSRQGGNKGRGVVDS